MGTDACPRAEMTKVMEVYGRNKGFTREAFLVYQTGKHMEAAGSVPEFSGRIRGATRNTIYVEEDHLPLPAGHPACTAGKDSVVELWFDDPTSAVSAFREPRYLEIVRPDEAAFSDVSEGWSLLCREKIVMEKTGFEGREKIFLFLRRRDPVVFKHEWEMHRPRFLDAVQSAGVGRVAENTAVQGAFLDNAGAFDFALELWCGDMLMATDVAGGAGIRMILSGAAAGLFDQDVGGVLYLAQERE